MKLAVFTENGLFSRIFWPRGLVFHHFSACTAKMCSLHLPDGQKVDFFGQKSKKFLGPGMSKMDLWDHIECPKVFARIFCGRGAVWPGPVGLPNSSFGRFEPAVRCTVRRSKSRFFGQKSKKIPGSRKVKYGSGGPYDHVFLWGGVFFF